MNDLITITEREGQKVVSARELHEFLELGEDFTNWAKRMISIGFEEGKHFTLISAKSTGGRPKADYAITLDTAKHWALVQKNDKGMMIRDYFIEKEKEANRLQIDLTNPDTLIQIGQTLKKEQTLRLEAEKQVAKLAPKADLADRALIADGLIDIGQCAKALQLPYGRNILFEKLRERGLLFKNPRNGQNEPKQLYINNGCFKVKLVTIKRHSHPDLNKLKIWVTTKGLNYINSLLSPSNKTLIINT